MDPTALERACGIIARASASLVISGAGMSAECGIPTFRQAGDGDAWNGLARSLATPQGLRSDARVVWSWYRERRQQERTVAQLAGYIALVALDRRAAVSIVTQNIDGLHARAGSARVVEMHRSLFRFVCADRGHEAACSGDEDDVPHCPVCGSLVRPAVVWFGERIPEQASMDASAALLAAEVVLVVGTSLAVNTPAALLRSADRRGIPIIKVNPEPALPAAASYTSDLPPATVSLTGAAGTVLPQLLGDAD